MAPHKLTRELKDIAHQIGFDLVGVAPAVSPDGYSFFHEWLNRGYAGEMNYLENRLEAYSHPRFVLESVRSILMLGMNYHTEITSHPQEQQSSSEKKSTEVPARISRYAWGSRDYHDVIRERLKQLGDSLHKQLPGCRTRGVIDTAPLLERDFARLAGLGWFGKNTMLINKRQGSWLFLAALLTDVELEYDAPHETAHCGTCTRCLDACPTDAFPEAYVLDASRCLSYLNIELRDSISEEFRSKMGDWLFGCDICQDVCPWNRKAPISKEPAFQPVNDFAPADAISLLQLTPDEFRTRFRDTPMWRARRAGLLRNAAIVLGNSKNPAGIPVLVQTLGDEEPLIRGATAWALGKIGGEKSLSALQSRCPSEDNPEVLQEIKTAIQKLN
ncbi:MAG: tRNA epoxyqueuosine(34) reductase QueG [Planctomycetaceae bacterium]